MSSKTRTGFVFVMILVAVVGSFYIYRARKAGEAKRVAQDVEATLPSGSDTNGEVYNNNTMSLRIVVPQGYLVEEYSPVSVFLYDQQEATASSRTSFAYASLMAVYKEHELRDGYAYDSAEYDNLMKLAVGETAVVSTDEARKKNISFSREEDTEAAGKKVRSFLNTAPLDMPRGVVEHRYVFEERGRIGMLGGFVSEAEGSR